MKRMKYLWVLLFAVTLSLPSESFAAPPSSTVRAIEEVVQVVLRDNPELKFYQDEIRAAKGEERASGLLTNPELEASIGRKEDLSREGTAWSVSVMQPFEFPGRLSLRKAIANRQVKLAELGFERFRSALAAKARQSAYELLAAQQISEAASEVSIRGQELVSVLVQREPAGVTPILETRIIEASVIPLQKRAIDAEGEAQSALFELNQLTGDSFTTAVQVTPSELRFNPIPPIEELVVSALESNFDLRMKVEELKAQGFRVELARNERYPGFKVGPFLSQERAGETERVAGLGISVPLPIWDQNTGSVRAAKAREDQARTSLLLTQRQIERTIRENALVYEKRRQEIQRWRPNIVTELKEAAALGDRHYRLGAIPVSIYIELQSQYIEALEAILSIQRDALTSLQTLETYTGKELRELTNASLGAER